MNFIKKISKAFLISILFLLISTFFITLLNYINVLNIKLINIFMYIIPFLSFFLGGIVIGRKSNNKIILESLKFSLISILLMILITYLIFKKFSIKNIILSLIIISSSILGSLIGFKKIVK